MSNLDSQVTRKELRATLEEHFQHVLGHNPQDCKAVVSLAAHTQPDGSIHSCTMVGGDMVHVAIMLANAIEELCRRDLLFAVAFMQAVNRDSTTEAAETAVSEPLNSIKARKH